MQMFNHSTVWGASSINCGIAATGSYDRFHSLRDAPPLRLSTFPQEKAKKQKGEYIMDKIKKPKWWDEFTAFAIKGNAMALAVGTIIGAAFSTITKSLTDDIIMPIVSIFIGGVDFSEMKLTLPRLFAEKLDENGNVILNTLNYGNFISAIINFLILALVVFFLVKGLNKLSEAGKKKEAEAVETPAEPEPTKEELLLTEIRDLLKQK